METALITGAANGIGLALCKIHLHQGHKVVMVDNNQTQLQKQHEELMHAFPHQIMAFACDVSSALDIKHLVLQLKQHALPLHWIYNNAGIIGELGPVWELPLNDIKKVCEVNLFGMIHLIQAIIPLLFEQAFESHIVNIASLYALYSGSQTSSYAMSKHAVLALSESLYFDLKRAEKNIHVSVAFPSFTDTGLLANKKENDSAFHQVLQQLMTHSRPAHEVAHHIVDAVSRKEFYIFPDKEVKGYCEERYQALVYQEDPAESAVEKLLGSLLAREIRKSTQNKKY